MPSGCCKWLPSVSPEDHHSNFHGANGAGGPVLCLNQVAGAWPHTLKGWIAENGTAREICGGATGQDSEVSLLSLAGEPRNCHHPSQRPAGDLSGSVMDIHKYPIVLVEMKYRGEMHRVTAAVS